MELALIIIILVIIFVLSIVYAELKISRKKRIAVDAFILLIMLVVTLAYKMPINMLFTDLLYFVWVLLGHLFGYFEPKIWFQIEKKIYKKLYGISITKSSGDYEDHSFYRFKLVYYLLELTLISFFICMWILNAMQQYVGLAKLLLFY